MTHVVEAEILRNPGFPASKVLRDGDGPLHVRGVEVQTRHRVSREVRFGLEGLCDARDVIGFEGHRGVDVTEKKTEK